MADQSSKPASHVRKLGLTQRTTPLTTPWTGDFRVRFTDFQVNEIGENGKVFHLRTIGRGESKPEATESLPTREAKQVKEEPAEPAAPKETNANKNPEQPQQIEVSEEDQAKLGDLAGKTFTDELLQLVKNGHDKTPDAPTTAKSGEVDDKWKRGQIHQEIRRIFNSRVETSTDDSGAIIAKLVKSRGGARKRGRTGRGGGPAEKPAGQYLHFNLYKDNKDTMEAVSLLARFLKVKPQVINYAGTKDRRASTVQRCSVRYTTEKALAGVNSRTRGIVTGDYEYSDDPIHLGQLLGNEFTITVKNCRTAGDSDQVPTVERLEKIKANVQSAMDYMAEHGWINYFGHQRFGTYKIGTHEIGRFILGEKYEEAVNALLNYDPEIAERADKGEVPNEAHARDDFARQRACMLFKTDKNPEEAVNIMPRRFSAEVAILRHLTRSGKQSRRDFVGALVSITRGLRSMFLHAYQSYVWNHAASRRWELFGEKVVKGDLVLVDSAKKATENGAEEQQDGDDIINPGGNGGGGGGADDDDDATQEARPLSEEEASSGRFTIRDVVLPSPGFDVVYPDNELGAFYTAFMGREENGGLDPLKMRRMRREFSLPGRYRKLVGRFLAAPSVELQAYADDTEQMHPTDLDMLTAAGKGKAAPRGDAAGNKRGREEAADAVGEEPSEKKAKVADAGADQGAVVGDGVSVATAAAPEAVVEGTTDAAEQTAEQRNKIAAVLKFQLGKSAYATIVLRELMGDAPEATEERTA